MCKLRMLFSREFFTTFIITICCVSEVPSFLSEYVTKDGKSSIRKGTRSGCQILIICWLCAISSSPLAGAADDGLAIEEMVDAVSLESLKEFVTDLQENRDLNFPDRVYGSRFCLRVRDTDNPSDGACDNAAEYIYSRFVSYGLDVEYDPFVHEVKEREHYKGRYRMRNVVATLPGKGPKSHKTYIICAHYDSIAGLQAGWMWDWKTLPAPGADDNASGTVAVLEAARILSNYDFDYTIRFIAFSGEELGMFGSKHYAQAAAAAGDQIAGVINLDMIAYDPDKLDIDIVTDEDSRWLANLVHRVGEIHGIDLMVNRMVAPEMVYSDHSPFWRSGYSAVFMSEGSDKHSDEFSPINHTPDDTLEKLDFELALKTSRLAVGALAQLADPITGPDDVVRPDLMVSIIGFSHIPYRRGDTITVTASVSNLGPGDVEDISVQMWLVPPVTGAHPELMSEWMMDLGENASYEISSPMMFDEWGDYQVLVKVNPDSRIFESDFNNNMARRTISISAELGLADLVAYPNPAVLANDGEVNLRYKLSQDADVTMEIYDIEGRLAYSEKFAPGENGGKRGPNNHIKWNGVNQSLNPVAAGVYICRVVAADNSGEKRWASKKLAIVR